MTQELILITGGTGFVGYACVARALHQGYRVRLAIRNESDVEKIKTAPSCRPYTGAIEFTVVKDICQEAAFNDAMKDVSYVIHVASPTPGPDKAEPFHDSIVKPAVSGTVNVLQAAAKVPSVKRVVITSSVSVFLTDDPTRVHDETTLAPVPDDSFATKDVYAAYHTSKVLAYKSTQDFIRDTKPLFPIINIMPSFVIGKHELLTTPEDIISPKTSNSVALGPIFDDGMPFPMPCAAVHIDDVANVHVAALDPKIDGNQDFALNAGGIEGMQWNDAKEIVKRRFPEAVDKGLLPLKGSTETKSMKIDASKAERVFNFRYKDFEEQIMSVVGHYLDAVERSNQ
ncbi:MAG: hypothetical protein Q9171_004467 [Xanthocarpia ochracea]